MVKTKPAAPSVPYPELKGAERITLAQGAVIYILRSNRLGSAGYYELAPEARVKRTRLSLEEKLTQAEGESIVTVFDADQGPLVHHLSHGGELRILPGEDHTHMNQSGHVSLTKWEFEGDATALIDTWRREARRHEKDDN